VVKAEEQVVVRIQANRQSKFYLRVPAWGAVMVEHWTSHLVDQQVSAWHLVNALQKESQELPFSNNSI